MPVLSVIHKIANFLNDVQRILEATKTSEAPLTRMDLNPRKDN